MKTRINPQVRLELQPSENLQATRRPENPWRTNEPKRLSYSVGSVSSYTENTTLRAVGKARRVVKTYFVTQVVYSGLGASCPLRITVIKAKPVSLESTDFNGSVSS
jgi:hypothetical protein